MKEKSLKKKQMQRKCFRQESLTAQISVSVNRYFNACFPFFCTVLWASTVFWTDLVSQLL